MRVPLISPMTVVIQRLELGPTQGVVTTPEGAGFDPDFREPVGLQGSGGSAVTDTRVYGEEIKIPCQVEFKTYEELQMVEQGDAGLTKIAAVLHRKHLKELDLLDDNGNVTLKKGDKIVRFEKQGRTVLVPSGDLYVYRIDPASQGFGPDGYDLHIMWTSDRASSVTGR